MLVFGAPDNLVVDFHRFLLHLKHLLELMIPDMRLRGRNLYRDTLTLSKLVMEEAGLVQLTREQVSPSSEALLRVQGPQQLVNAESLSQYLIYEGQSCCVTDELDLVNLLIRSCDFFVRRDDEYA